MPLGTSRLGIVGNGRNFPVKWYDGHGLYSSEDFFPLSPSVVMNIYNINRVNNISSHQLKILQKYFQIV